MKKASHSFFVVVVVVVFLLLSSVFGSSVDDGVTTTHNVVLYAYTREELYSEDDGSDVDGDGDGDDDDCVLLAESKESSDIDEEKSDTDEHALFKFDEEHFELGFLAQLLSSLKTENDESILSDVHVETKPLFCEEEAIETQSSSLLGTVAAQSESDDIPVLFRRSRRRPSPPPPRSVPVKHYLSENDFRNLKDGCESITKLLLTSADTKTTPDKSDRDLFCKLINDISLKYDKMSCLSRKKHQRWVYSILGFPNALLELFDHFHHLMDILKSSDMKRKACYTLKAIFESPSYSLVLLDFSELVNGSHCNLPFKEIIEIRRGISSFQTLIEFFVDEFKTIEKNEDEFDEEANAALIHQILEEYATGQTKFVELAYF